jgi:hypothetical protein
MVKQTEDISENQEKRNELLKGVGPVLPSEPATGKQPEKGRHNMAIQGEMRIESMNLYEVREWLRQMQKQIDAICFKVGYTDNENNPMCPECLDIEMDTLAVYRHNPLYRCPNCGLEQYASNLADKEEAQNQPCP